MSDFGTCQSCGRRQAIGVAAVPLIPITITWCKRCLEKSCVGPYSLHWANLASMFCEDTEAEFSVAHSLVLLNLDKVVPEYLDLTVYKEGYKTLRDALKEGPPQDA